MCEGGVLPLCSDAVGVFYILTRLGNVFTERKNKTENLIRNHTKIFGKVYTQDVSAQIKIKMFVQILKKYK